MTTRFFFGRICFGTLLSIALLTSMDAVAEEASPDGVNQQQYKKTVAKAIAFLKTKGQSPDGSYSSHAGIGPTALITVALQRQGMSASDPTVAKSLAYLEKFSQADGGIYKSGSMFRNYETCLAMLCFTEANQDGRYNQRIKMADAFIKGLQWGEDKGQDPSDIAYGGGGYGKHKRPDLSNTSFLIDALKASGNDPESDAIQRALIFVSRCQNLESEHNTTPFSAKSPDGGFYYTPAAGGSSPAGKTANGGLRSYGAMTYAGLKSMLYAGVSQDDPRVKAAVQWVSKHYDLKENPGLGTAGLFYYYHLLAKAMHATGKDILTDSDNNKHNWRAEMIAELASRQRPDGSWVNSNDRWFEGDANLTTGYALLTLSYCRP